MKYAEVYTGIKTLEVNHPFDYSVPEGFIGAIHPGSMVVVPFGNRKEIGFVTKVKSSTDIASKDLKPVADVIGDIPVFDRDSLRLIYWMSGYYLQPFGKIIEFFLPPGNKDRVLQLLKNPETFFRYKTVIYLNDTGTGGFEEIYRSKRLRGQQKVLDILKRNDGITVREIMSRTGVSRQTVKALLEKGFVKIQKIRILNQDEGEVNPIKQQIHGEKDDLKDKKVRPCFSGIADCISGNLYRVFILYDFSITDRIDIYRFLCNCALEENKKALILTPEIVDAENLARSLAGGELKGKHLIFHSGLKASEQLSSWYRAYTGSIDTIIGNRSAIFLPLKKIGLIIIDEEHDPSYKESTSVRYNLQDIALKLGSILGIPVVFASNTPSMRIWHRTKNDKDFEVIRSELSFFRNNKVQREVLDLKTLDRFKEDINITGSLYRTIKNAVESGNKALVFFNKRGYSSYLLCRDCGDIPTCPKCQISFSFHSSSGRLVCHHCSHDEVFTGKCKACGSDNIQFRGTGIEKIESKLKARFKGTTVLRVDSDLIRDRRESRKIAEILKADGPLILLGTQKILKNRAIRDLTVASIVNYDSLFQLPDFQVNERVFQLMVEILSKMKNTDKSKFIIQAFKCKNEVLDSFVSGDYEDFYEKEIKKRQDLYYPPISNLINIIVSGRDNSSVRCDINLLAERVSKIKKPKFFILGPAPAPFHKINFLYRWHLLIKTESVMKFNLGLGNILKDFRKNDENKIIFDIDPVWIL